MQRIEELHEIFANIDPEQQKLLEPVFETVCDLEEQMAELKKLPFLSVHPKNKAVQKTTAAARLYKECSQSYSAYIRILLSVLKKDSSADKLMEMLKEFE